MRRGDMRHILLITKEPMMNEFVYKELQQLYKVDIIPYEEFTKVEQIQPDLVLLSVSKEEDLDAIPWMSKIPVILFVSEEDSVLESRAYQYGVSEVVRLPLNIETLQRRIDLQMELVSYRAKNHEYIAVQEAISVSLAELVERRDGTTGGHQKSTTIYFKIFLLELLSRPQYKNVVSQDAVADLVKAAPLHDIGKIGINDGILRKVSSLDDYEYDFMKTHTTLGRDTFEKIMKETGETRFLRFARDLAYSHHERWDGLGYPSGLKEEEIPIYVRILSIVDVYDALTSRRTYKEAYSHREAMLMIEEGKGSRFDPSLIDIFIEIQDRFKQALIEK